MPPPAIALRNQLAEWAIAAVGVDGDRLPLDALHAFLQAGDSGATVEELGDERARCLLAAASCFEADEGRVRLREEHREARARIAARLELMRIATERGRGATGHLERAAHLFDAGLFFETHEILEGPWQRAQEPERSFLQGLIQLAVGLHHHENENLHGAVALLRDGLAKLARDGRLPQGFLESCEGLAELARGQQLRGRAQAVPGVPSLAAALASARPSVDPQRSTR